MSPFLPSKGFQFVLQDKSFTQKDKQYKTIIAIKSYDEVETGFGPRGRVGKKMSLIWDEIESMAGNKMKLFSGYLDMGYEKLDVMMLEIWVSLAYSQYSSSTIWSICKGKMEGNEPSADRNQRKILDTGGQNVCLTVQMNHMKTLENVEHLNSLK